MSDTRIKKRSFNISIFNIKILPKETEEDFTNLYVALIKKLHSDNIATNTRGEKWMEMRTQYSFENDKVLYGKLIYYTMLDGSDWYNKRLKAIQAVEIDKDLYPNVKEIEYYFIPEVHRFCFINKTNGIAMSQIDTFLHDALPHVVPDGKDVFISQELTSDVIERIMNAHKLLKLEIDLTYSNNDLSEDFEELFDNDLRDSQIQNLNLKATSFKSETINIGGSKVLKAALRLSQSNGYAEATIQNENGKNENIATVDYPRKELIHSSNGNEHRDVFEKIKRLFRND